MDMNLSNVFALTASVSSAVTVTLIAAIIIYGAETLGLYSANGSGCLLENKGDSQTIVDFSDSAQLLVPVGLGATLLVRSVTYMFHGGSSPTTESSGRVYFFRLASVVLTHLVIVSAFMTMYAILTTKCDAASVDETESVKLIAYFFLGIMGALALVSHEMFFGPSSDGGDLQMAKSHLNPITHIAAVFEAVLLVTGFTYSLRVIDEDTTYTANCRELWGIHNVSSNVSSTYDNALNPVENGHFKGMVISGLSFASIQLAIRLYEAYNFYMSDDKASADVEEIQHMYLSPLARILSFGTRLMAGVFVAGLILSNRVEGCEPYEINTNLKNAAGIMLGVLYPSILHMQSPILDSEIGHVYGKASFGL